MSFGLARDWCLRLLYRLAGGGEGGGGGRPISVSAVPVGPGTNIGRSCMFLGSIIRALRGLPGGLARFLPCGIGAHHCRLRHLGWEKCGHGLTSRPRETSDPSFLDSILGVFGYPAGSGKVLLDGHLPLRYYSGSFALRKPTWKLPERGGVRTLVTDGFPCDGLGRSELGSCWRDLEESATHQENGQFTGSATWGTSSCF